jgi:uncharacterized protein YdiU (UPF0061 family)
MINSLDELQFDNTFIRELPADSEPNNYCRQVIGACYSRVLATPVKQPQLISYSPEVAQLLNLSDALCHSDAFVQVFSGNQLSKGMDSYASCYGGHQFGHWAGQLGDGRAINLGEIINKQGQRLALQLKGAGKTPYSRNSDGLAVLRSSIREFLCSEAMYHLGVPTTRALSLVLTGELVLRDMFYNGNARYEQGAIVCRIAPSFTRFGHFQLLTSRNDYGLLKRLVNYTITTDFPHLGEPSINTYGQWFKEICQRTAEMVVHWQRVGFVHGVMNTDNMSILGLTIDYGPYGWLEDYNPNWTPNTTDAGQNRYCFGNQPAIAFWNLSQLANSLYPLIKTIKPLEEGLQHYNKTFETAWQTMMITKLGLNQFELDSDDDLIADLLALLQSVETDMTIFYRQLAHINISETITNESLQVLDKAYYRIEQLTDTYKSQRLNWFNRYQQRIKQAAISEKYRIKTMNAVNPKYVLRNYLAQLAIDKAEQGDYSEIEQLLTLLKNPYAEQLENNHYSEKRPDWARQRAGCSMLSCSS